MAEGLNPPAEELQERLQNLWRASGLGVRGVAKQMERVGRAYSPAVISDALRGRGVPRAELLSALLTALDVPYAEQDDLISLRAQAEARRDQIKFANGDRPVIKLSQLSARRPYVPKFGQPDPIGVSSPAELQQALVAVRVWGGSPSLRDLERRSNGVLRRSTISDMLRGEPSVPDYDRYLAFLRACGVDDASLDVWVFTWRRLVALKQSPEVAGWMGGMTPASRS
ncbi:helix-turn-helix domain-containing protein [Streptomyces sp. NPDC002394]